MWNRYRQREKQLQYIRITTHLLITNNPDALLRQRKPLRLSYYENPSTFSPVCSCSYYFTSGPEISQNDRCRTTPVLMVPIGGTNKYSDYQITRNRREAQTQLFYWHIIKATTRIILPATADREKEISHRQMLFRYSHTQTAREG